MALTLANGLSQYDDYLVYRRSCTQLNNISITITFILYTFISFNLEFIYLLTIIEYKMLVSSRNMDDYI